MNSTALVYCEGNFGLMDGKTANGLIRRSHKYNILGVIDSTKAGGDSGIYLDGKTNGIPIYSSLKDAIRILGSVPDYFIYGMAPASAFLTPPDREIFLAAMKQGMNIVNPLYELLNEDEEFVKKAKKYHVTIEDVRRTPPRKDLHNFTGRILQMNTPVIAVLGTDSAIGKRTTAVLLEQAFLKKGLKPIFIGTGQTGIMQGAKYSIPLDSIPSQYAIGEIENVIMTAYEEEHPDLFIIEGQGSLSSPAYISSCIILRGARPAAVILQHAPKRKKLGDFPFMNMPSLESEIQLIETFSQAKVVSITLNHESMSEAEIGETISLYEKNLGLPASDVLKYGCDKIVACLMEKFPTLQKALPPQTKKTMKR